MSRRMSIATGILVALAALFALLLAASVPALAHHKDGHEQGTQSEENEASETNSETEQQSSEASSEDEGSQDDYAPKGGGKGKKSESTTSDSSSTSDSTAQQQQQGGGSGDKTDPDPEPVSSPEKTTGPDCNDKYDQRDAGAYDHNNCDNTQGLHGNGGNGKCAGCTGKADDKAPGGQHPGDHNNGYECDHNSGVGKGNPPHAKCKPPAGPPPPPPPPPPPGCPPNSNAPQCNPDVVEVCDKDMNPNNGVQACVNQVGPCDAIPSTPMIEPCRPDVVLGRRDFVPPERPPTPPTPPEIAPRPPLPFTGAGSTAGLMFIGLVMMVLGSVLMRATRRA